MSEINVVVVVAFVRAQKERKGIREIAKSSPIKHEFNTHSRD